MSKDQRQLLLGTTAMAAASTLRVAIQIAILPIVGRLIGPQAYGQIALVAPFVFFALLLSESGLGACIVRAATVTPELEGTILSFSGGLSLFLMMIFALLAYPLGALMHEPNFPSLLMGMSSILLFGAATIVPSALLLRTKRYDYVALSDVAASVGSVIGVGIGIAYNWGAWCLVAQQIGLWTAKVAVVSVAAHWRPRFAFRPDILKAQMSFGSRLTGSSILAFVARNIDNVLIGAFMGAQNLGYYALAFQIVGLPSSILSGSVYYTVFSGTSEAHRAGTFTLNSYYKILRSTLLLGAPTIVGVAVTAPLSVPLLLGDKWAPTITLIMLLAPLGLQQMITAITDGVNIGLGRSDLVLRLGIISSTLTVSAIIVGVFFNSNAVAIGVSAAAIGTCYLHMKTIAEVHKGTWHETAKAVAVPLIASFLMGAAVYGLRNGFSSDIPLAAQLALSIAAGIVSYVFFLFFLFRDHLLADITLLKNAFYAHRTAND